MENYPFYGVGNELGKIVLCTEHEIGIVKMNNLRFLLPDLYTAQLKPTKFVSNFTNPNT